MHRYEYKNSFTTKARKHEKNLIFVLIRVHPWLKSKKKGGDNMLTKASVRTERWLRKYNEPNPIKRQYVSSQVAYEFDLQEKTDKAIKEVLADTNVSTILNIPYLNFGRRIFSLAKRYSGNQLQAEIDFEMYKYSGRGLDKEVLKRILDVVLNMFKQPTQGTTD